MSRYVGQAPYWDTEPLMMCNDCGSVVVSTSVHDAWHLMIEEALR